MLRRQIRLLAGTFVWAVVISGLAHAQFLGDLDGDGDVDLDDVRILQVCFAGPGATPPAMCAPSVCGDGIVQIGEECDDGGLCTGDDATACTNDSDCAVPGGTCTARNADGCSAACNLEEVCDDSTDNDGDLLVDCDDPDCCAVAVCPNITFTVSGTIVDGEAIPQAGLEAARVAVQHSIDGFAYTESAFALTDMDGNYGFSATFPVSAFFIRIEVVSAGYNTEFSDVLEVPECGESLVIPDIIMFFE